MDFSAFRIQQLQVDRYGLQPLLQEIKDLMPGNAFERQQGVQQLEEVMRRSQGLVLKRGEQIVALAVYLIRGNSCRLSFAYALKGESSQLMLQYLFQGLLSLAESDPNIDSIRFDIVPWFPLNIELALKELGFTCVERMLMRRCEAYPIHAPSLPREIKLVPWDTWLTTPVAQILLLAFGGGFEGSWDRSLKDLSGCKQFLADCYSGRFGTFDARISFALQQENLLIGMSLASWSTEGEGFIPAFGLLPQFTGQGLGSIMLAHLLKRYGESAFPPQGIELAVSEENHAALHLYQKYGFMEKSRFRVYYLDIHHQTQ